MLESWPEYDTRLTDPTKGLFVKENDCVEVTPVELYVSQFGSEGVKAYENEELVVEHGASTFIDKGSEGFRNE